jgi:hypothetical protein
MKHPDVTNQSLRRCHQLTVALAIVVGFPSGGPSDIVARVIGQWLSERLGQPFIIENRPGAAGNIVPRRSRVRPPTAIRSFWSLRQTRFPSRFTIS